MQFLTVNYCSACSIGFLFQTNRLNALCVCACTHGFLNDNHVLWLTHSLPIALHTNTDTIAAICKEQQQPAAATSWTSRKARPQHLITIRHSKVNPLPRSVWLQLANFGEFSPHSSPNRSFWFCCGGFFKCFCFLLLVFKKLICLFVVVVSCCLLAGFW